MEPRRAYERILLLSVLIEYSVHLLLEFLVPITLVGVRRRLHLQLLHESTILQLHRIEYVVLAHQFTFGLLFPLRSVQVLDSERSDFVNVKYIVLLLVLLLGVRLRRLLTQPCLCLLIWMVGRIYARIICFYLYLIDAELLILLGWLLLLRLFSGCLSLPFLFLNGLFWPFLDRGRVRGQTHTYAVVCLFRCITLAFVFLFCVFVGFASELS